MGVMESSGLFLTLNHWAALGAAGLFAAESVLIGLALAGIRPRGAAKAP